jgi:hypothetical protein
MLSSFPVNAKANDDARLLKQHRRKTARSALRTCAQHFPRKEEARRKAPPPLKALKPLSACARWNRRRSCLAIRDDHEYLISKPILAFPRGIAHRRLRTAQCQHSERISANSRGYPRRATRCILFISENARALALEARRTSANKARFGLPVHPSVDAGRYRATVSRILNRDRVSFLIASRDPDRSRDRRDHVGIAAWTSRVSAWRNFPRKIMHSRAHGARRTRSLSIRGSIRFP